MEEKKRRQKKKDLGPPWMIARNSGKFYVSDRSNAFYPLTPARVNNVLHLFGLEVRQWRRPKKIAVYRIGRSKNQVIYETMADVAEFVFILQKKAEINSEEKFKHLKKAGL